jgi:hypothetical protein
MLIRRQAGGPAGLEPLKIAEGTRPPAVAQKYTYILVDNSLINCIESETGKLVYQPQRIEPGT